MPQPLVDETHSSAARSWVESANAAGTDFPVQNLPVGIFSSNTNADERVGVAVGDVILDLIALPDDILDECGIPREVFASSSLRALMALPSRSRKGFRSWLFSLLRSDSPFLRTYKAALEAALVPMSAAEMHLTAGIGGYTDFYASIYHATNVGKLFRPDNPLLPNYKYVPIAYHGRTSTLGASPEVVVRPRGQLSADPAQAPVYAPCANLDYEMEMGFFVAGGVKQGESLSMAEAREHIFGLCIVNDWSARDIQRWEYQPLGPFLAKNFATTLSPWVVTTEALAPFCVSAFARAEGDPQPLPHLFDAGDQSAGGFDITVEVSILTANMRAKNLSPHLLSKGNMKDLYWTITQMLCHHASNGCRLDPSDLLATGTISGAKPDSSGCLLELTDGGKQPITLPSGETRTFLQDGDEIIMRAFCAGEGFVRIGFGECRGLIAPATVSASGGTR